VSVFQGSVHFRVAVSFLDRILFHQISQHRVQDAAVAVVVHLHIGIQQHRGFELDDLTLAPLALSKFPVGSSANRTWAPVARVRAIATR